MTFQEIANIALWALQIFLAIGFVFVGFGHAFQFDRFAAQERTAWVLAVGRTNLRAIGLLEIAGAIGLVLPAATDILPWLTVLAAFGLAVLMTLAVIFHVPRKEPFVGQLVMSAMALIVALGRIFVAPF